MGENASPSDSWSAGEGYEPYVGRWSRLVAREFVRWLNVPAGGRWLDVGCGTGALSRTILEAAEPAAVAGIDRSPDFVRFAREHVQDPRASFKVGDAMELPVEAAGYDAVVSGLVLNFIPQPSRAAEEMMRAARGGGIVAAYVWDYAGEMQLMRYFWDAAAALEPDAVELDEGRRFPICKPDPLVRLFHGVGLASVEVNSIDIPTVFRDFDDFWMPFLGGQGPAPSYLMSLDEDRRSAVRERLWERLPFAHDGSIPLMARAWAVRGVHQRSK